MKDKVAEASAGSNYVPPSKGSLEFNKSAPAHEASPAEGKPDANPTPESYTAQGRLTPDQWKEKVSKYNKSVGKEPKKPKKDAEPPAAQAGEPVAEDPPAEDPQKPGEQPLAEGAEPAQEGEPAEEGEVADPQAPATPAKFTVNPKFTAVGKEYTLPDYLAKAISSPEQEKEVKDLYTKAMGLDHVKMRHQELTDKHTQLSQEHHETVEAIQDLSEIYQEAVKTQNPLLLNHFFDQLQIPHQVILQYAQKLAEFYESDPSQQQQVMMSLTAYRQAREAGKQNQRLTQGNRQFQVQARTVELDSALAKPEIAPFVAKFEAQYGPGSFRQELIRNGIYVHKTENRDLSIAENVNQVVTRFGLNAAPAAAQAPGMQPQAAPGAAAQPAPAANPSPAPAPQGQQQPQVVPAQPHRKVPTIPAVNGKSGTSPTKQAPRSVDDIRKIRKQKYGH